MLETTQFCDEVKPFQRSNHNLSCVLSSLFMVTSHFETKDHYMNEQLVKSPCLYGVLSPCFHDSSIFPVFDLHFWYAKPPMFERLKTILPWASFRSHRGLGDASVVGSRAANSGGDAAAGDAGGEDPDIPGAMGGSSEKHGEFFVGSLGCRMGIWWVYHIYI